MLGENGVFQIDSSTPHSELENIYKEILKNLKEIKVIEVNQTADLSSAALITLLKTVKFNNLSINIPLIENQDGYIKGVGKFVIIERNNITN